MCGSIVDAALTAMTYLYSPQSLGEALPCLTSMLRRIIELLLSLQKTSLKAERHRSLFVETTGGISPREESGLQVLERWQTVVARTHSAPPTLGAPRSLDSVGSSAPTAVLD